MIRLILTLLAVSFVGQALAIEEDEPFYIKPGSPQGHIAVANTQTFIPETVFTEAVEVLRENKRYAFRFGRDKSILDGAIVRLTIVDEPTNLTPMTVSPEVGQGVLNVAALTNDLRSTELIRKFLRKRAKLEFLRLVCYSLGVGSSRFDGNLLSATSLRDLDSIDVFVPVDAFCRLEESAAKRGLKPEVVASYQEACEQGWAPTPMNEHQKAIWNKVYTPPKNPMKIEFDPKKGR